MKYKIILNLFFLILFSANQVFATQFYYQASKTRPELFIGDLNFSYSFLKNEKSSDEIIESGLTRIIVQRSTKDATMWIERKTRLGFLYLKYKNVNQTWENSSISFARYNTFFKDDGDDSCSVPPPIKNKIDLADIVKSTEIANFGQLFFEQNCSKKLSEEEFKKLTEAIYKVVGADKDTLASLKKPEILRCVKDQGQQSDLYAPFKTMRNQVTLQIKNAENSTQIQNNKSLLIPVSCDFDGSKTSQCGKTQEGLKTKISIDVSCLKKSPEKFEELAQEIFVHEFAHTIRKPKIVSEKQIRENEKGNCEYKDFLFTGNTETDLTKNDVVKKLNSEQTGTKSLTGEVVNPYSSFAERATTPTAAQNTNVASNESSSGTTEVTGGSGSSGLIAQQRNIASTNTFNVGSSSTSSTSNYSVPSIQQQAQYQNVKTYVDASVNTVAKKIAPIVSYVESPAFAQTLPPTSFENGNRGETSAAVGGTMTTEKSAAVNRAAATTGRTGEVASVSSSGGSSGEVASGSTANLGSSSSSGGSRSPAAVNKNANRLSSDPGLDNAYALKVRKKLLSDNAYRTELRNKGVQIEFADGYKFETPSSKVLYTEKNGVLVRGK